MRTALGFLVFRILRKPQARFFPDIGVLIAVVGVVGAILSDVSLAARTIWLGLGAMGVLPFLISNHASRLLARAETRALEIIGPEGSKTKDRLHTLLMEHSPRSPKGERLTMALDNSLRWIDSQGDQYKASSELYAQVQRIWFENLLSQGGLSQAWMRSRCLLVLSLDAPSAHSLLAIHANTSQHQNGKTR